MIRRAPLRAPQTPISAPGHLTTRKPEAGLWGPLWAVHEQPVADLPTFGPQCRFTVAFQTQRQAVPKVAV